MAQSNVECNEITLSMGYTINSVKIKGRWIPKEIVDNVESILVEGEVYDPALVSSAYQIIDNVFDKEILTNSLPNLKGRTSIYCITSKTCPMENGIKKVDIIFYVHGIIIDLFNAGNNTLLIPRSPYATLQENVPNLLFNTTPIIGITTDRIYGEALSLQLNSDLLHLSGSNGNQLRNKKLQIDLSAFINQSLSQKYYTRNLGINFKKPFYNDKAGWVISASYSENLQPQNSGDYRYSVLKGNLEFNKTLSLPFSNRFSAGVGTRILENNYSTTDAFMSNNETGYFIYSLNEASILKGVARMGIWYDASSPHGNSYGNYERLAGKLSFIKSLGKGHQTFDLEITTGGGYSWGPIPIYNQYYAGSNSWNFSYEYLNSTKLTTFPTTATARSLGVNEGGFQNSSGNVSGGNSMWHININLSIPISKFSKPLIPDIIFSEGPPSKTVAEQLKQTTKMAENAIIDDLIDNKGMSESEAKIEASKIINKDIRPAIDYLADRANIYSFKPILLFDIAQINSPTLNKTWVASGLGIQANLVVVKFEAGYLRTIAPHSDSAKDNIVCRFLIQNFY